MDDDTLPPPLTPRQVLAQADGLRALAKNAEDVLHAWNMGGYDKNWLVYHPADHRADRSEHLSLPLLTQMGAFLRDLRDESLAQAERIEKTVMVVEP